VKKHRSMIRVCMLAAALGGAAAANAQSAQVPAPGTGGSLPTLSAIRNEIHELYQLSSASLMRVDVQQSSAGVLTPALREEFDRWMKDLPSEPPAFNRSRGDGPGGRDGQGRDRGGMGGGRGGRPDGMGGPRGGGGGGGPMGPGGLNWNLVRAFLSDRADKADSAGRTDEAATLRGMAVSVSLYRNGFQGEVSAVLLTKDGYAMLPVGLLRAAHQENSTITATLPDGSKVPAKFVGTNLISGYTIIKLEKWQGIKPAAIAMQNIAPGDLLLFITAGQGQSGLLVAPGKPGAVSVDRLAVPAEERSGTFLFDVSGDMAAFVSGGSWNGGRQAFSSERLKREFNYILREHKDIEQRALGVTYKPLLPADATKIEAVLAGRRAVQVTKIQEKTLAANSGLKPDDLLLSIDGRPIGDFVAPDGKMPLPELIHLQADLATRKGTLPLGIIRGDKEQTIDVPLD